MLNFNNQLHDLARKNNRLKSRLRHSRVKNNTFKLNPSIKKRDLIFKGKSSIGTSFGNKSDIHVCGFDGNSGFGEIKSSHFKEQSESLKDYTLNKEGNVWIYTTVIDGEKISLISSDYERLCEKIRKRKLPF